MRFQAGARNPYATANPFRQQRALRGKKRRAYLMTPAAHFQRIVASPKGGEATRARWALLGLKKAEPKAKFVPPDFGSGFRLAEKLEKLFLS